MPTRRTQTVSEMLASKMSFSGPSYEQQELGAIDLTPLATPVVTASVFIVLFVAVPMVFWRAARRRRVLGGGLPGGFWPMRLSGSLGLGSDPWSPWVYFSQESLLGQFSISTEQATNRQSICNEYRNIVE